ncbi:adenosylcobinamide amidohydrolase [Marininema halotolerans]|uniref:Iron complex transport system ATP-binding protein n=1 Tax=Marininema halotolerans TaxID=1155944 RepID=A0A1I6RHU9_9BACL|nr:adenosylcobinamide amidohydrolase [Marininema halotolerans]SFS64323.1 iron complex transport system ATP-binding protein [Marininema halotolerans]
MKQTEGRHTLLHGAVILEGEKEWVHMEADQPLLILSSAFSGGGWRKGKHIVNRHVKKGYDEADPINETAIWLRKRGWDPEETVALLTAAWVEQGRIVEEEDSTGCVAAIVTAGLSNAARAGVDGPVYRRCKGAGTINTILLIDGELTPAAMVNAVIMATEAKTAALQDIKAQDAMGRGATGTTTDTIVVASTQRRKDKFLHEYAGAASPLGRLIGLSVYRATREALLQTGRLIGEEWPTT